MMNPTPVSQTRTKGNLVNARAMYLFYYMAFGSLVPFISLFYERMGLSGVQIGTLAALPVFVMASTSLLWGMLADAYRLHRRILSAAILLAPAAVFMLSRSTGYLNLLPWVFTYALFASPITPLLDGGALEAAGNSERNYGELRVFGSIGWAAATWLIGTLIQRLGIHWLFTGYIGLMGIAFFITLFQPARARLLQAPIRRSLRDLLARRGFPLFLLSVFCAALTLGTVSPFLSLYLDGIGASEGTIGLAWTLAAITEIPVMLGSGILVRRIKARGLLIVAFVVLAVRWFALSFIQNPFWALMTQLLHGLSFGAYWIGAVNLVNDWAPEGLETTAMAVLTIVASGLASIVGSLLGGFFYDHLGMSLLFRLLSLVALIGLAVFWSIKVPPSKTSARRPES